jgi:hypothetical protein
VSLPWWREEYDACVAAYRIDDPVIDVAAAFLLERPGDESPTWAGPLAWAFDALCTDVVDRGGWPMVERHLLSAGCDPVYIDLLSREVRAVGGNLASQVRGRHSPGSASLREAARRSAMAAEFDEIDVADDDDLSGLEPAPNEWAHQVFDTWYALDSQSTPPAPALIEVWRSTLEWIPEDAVGGWYVGARLEDLFRADRAGFGAWGPRMGPHRVEIIDAALGDSVNATNAWAGCWIRRTDESFGPWRDVLRRRGVDVGE